MAKKQKSTPPRNVPQPAPAKPVPVDPVGRLYFRIGAALALIVSLVLYTRTMAPSAPFWDAGEFIATALTLGVPHSPGTPLYVLIGRVFTLLPLPFTIAGKVNFISVVAGSLGVLMIYILVIRFLDHVLGKSESTLDTLIKILGALVGSFFIMFSNTFWSNAVETEVYTLSVFFMGFMTWLGLKWADNPGGPKSVAHIYLVFYLLALTVGLHLGTILAFVGVFLLILMTKGKTFSNTEFLLACFGVAIFVADATLYREGELTLVLLVLFGIALAYVYSRTKSTFAIAATLLFVLGISVHLYLKIRSGLNPMIDEADPETWRNLYAVLRREQYPPSDIFHRKASWGFQFEHFNNYFQDQFKMAVSYVGKLNLGAVIPLALGIWGMVDQFAKSRRTFIVLFSTWVVLSFGMILYLNFSDAEVRERDYFYLPAFYYFAIYIGIGAGSVLAEIRRFAARARMPVMASVVLPGLILFSFPFFTAKAHFFEHDRSGDWVCREYAMNMLVGIEENGIIFTNGDNDTFPLWYIQEVEGYRKDVRVVNLSLLNTPWYIKQLRDNSPPLDIQWTDAELARLRPVRTQDGSWILVRDLGVQHILKHNSGKRPIYFAVTIPPEVYEPYRDFMEMEGLAYRIVPKKGTNMVNMDKLEENVWENFSYKGILDDNGKRDRSVYQPPFVNRLIQNYAAAFTQLGFSRYQAQEYGEAIKNLEAAEQIAPNLAPVVMWLGWYYLENGDTARAVEYYETKIAENPRDCDIRYRLAGVQERINDLRGAQRTVDALTAACPDYRSGVVSAISLAVRFDELDRALMYVDNWLARHPEDEAMRRSRQQLLGRAPESRDSIPEVP